MPDLLTSTDKKALLAFARRSLSDALEDRPIPDPPSLLPATLKEPYNCFVTLLNPDRTLRGCIGTLESNRPLIENVAHFARAAALEDSRFDPVTKDELAGLIIEISVLGPTKPMPDLEHIVIGRHGLCVRSGNHHGVLLAKVAEEYGWTREQFLEETCRKAKLDPSEIEHYDVEQFEEISFSESDR